MYRADPLWFASRGPHCWRFAIAGARIAGQTAAGVRMAGISHRSIFKNMPIFRIAGQHRRIFAEGFLAIPVISAQANGLSRVAIVKRNSASLAIWGVCDSKFHRASQLHRAIWATKRWPMGWLAHCTLRSRPRPTLCRCSMKALKYMK